MVDYDDYDYEPSNPSYCGDTEFVSDVRSGREQENSSQTNAKNTM